MSTSKARLSDKTRPLYTQLLDEQRETMLRVLKAGVEIDESNRVMHMLDARAPVLDCEWYRATTEEKCSFLLRVFRCLKDLN